MIARLKPWRRPWVREFLETAYNDRKSTTQLQVLGSIGRFDRFLSSLSADDPRTWAAVTQEHVIRYLDEARKYALEDAKPFFAWLSWRKSIEPVVIPSHGGGLRRLRPLPRRLIRELFVQWTAPDADPQWALPALLSIVHAVPPGRLRQLRLVDVFQQDGQLRLRGMPELAEPVRDALGNFLDWRAAHYVGPSTYLLVTRANRFIDRPIGDHVLGKQACRHHPSVGMAQAAIVRRTVATSARCVSAWTKRRTSAVASAAARFWFAPSDPLPVTTRAYGSASRAVASLLAPSATINSASGMRSR